MTIEATATTTETTTATEAQTATATTAGASTEKMLSQTEVNRLVAQARREGRESAQRPAPAAAASSTTTTTDDTSPNRGQNRARIDELEKKLAFRDLADDHGVPKGIRDDMYDLFKAQNPTDHAEWFGRKSKQFSFGEAAVTTEQKTTAQATTTTPAQTPAPAMAPNGNVGPVGPIVAGANGIVNLFALTPAQIDQMGPQALRENFEKILEMGRQQSGAPPIPKAMRKG